MQPIKSNLNKDNCAPVSSNCVIWQGPSLSCINLCSGDTVSEVVYKLAEEICHLKDELNLSDLDLKCLVDNCITCPEPEKVLGIVLQLLINKVCDLQEIIDSLNAGTSDEVEVRLASCFIADFTDSNGDVTNPVPVSVYVQKIAQKICAILDRLDGIDLTLDGIDAALIIIDGRLDALEAAGLPQVTPICSSSPVPKDLDVALNGLESAFCSLRTATGLPGDILSAITDNECEPVAPATVIKSLVDPDVVLWSGASANVAETIEKLWLAVCDLRAAVSLIQDTCCTINCDDLIVDFDVLLKYDTVAAQYNLEFYFQKTDLPLAFGDCNPIGTKFTIADSYGHTNTIYIKIREDVLDDANVLTNGYIIELPGNIDPTAPLITLDSNVCITNGELNCVKCLHKEIIYTAPQCAYCEITATSDVTITYKICPQTTTTTTTSPGT